MRVILTMIYPIIGFFAVYLLGCFACASFNISEWSEMSRYSVSFIGGTVSLFLFMVPYTTSNED